MSLQSVYLRLPAWAQTIMLNAFALHIERHRYGSPYQSAVRRLMEMQNWTAEELRSYQDEHIRRVVATAFQKSPYYRRMMRDASVAPEDIAGVRDLEKLPILTKDVVRTRGEELRVQGGPSRSWLHGHTSGTTGSPVSLWYDRKTCVMTNAVDRRQKLWGGASEQDWIGLFLGRVVVPVREVRPPFWRVNQLHRQVWFSSFHMGEENLEAYAREIVTRKLRFLEGYPSTLFILASFLKRTGHKCPMQAVFTSSETLHAVQREVIESAFDCEIFDFYGHAERTIFAAECEAHAGKHLAEEFGYTEVVDDYGNRVPDGEPGYLVGTSLHNEAMPMIRYKTDDISAIVPEPCRCGRTLRRIRSVTTKAEDIILTPEGRMISPSVLTHPFKPFDQILKSQVIQEELDRVRVRLVPSGHFRPEHEQALVGSLQERLGPRISIEIELVDHIPTEASGKFRWVISHVDHSCSFSWDSTIDKASSPPVER